MTVLLTCQVSGQEATQQQAIQLASLHQPNRAATKPRCKPGTFLAPHNVIGQAPSSIHTRTHTCMHTFGSTKSTPRPGDSPSPPPAPAAAQHSHPCCQQTPCQVSGQPGGGLTLLSPASASAAAPVHAAKGRLGLHGSVSTLICSQEGLERMFDQDSTPAERRGGVVKKMNCYVLRVMRIKVIPLSVLGMNGTKLLLTSLCMESVSCHNTSQS